MFYLVEIDWCKTRRLHLLDRGSYTNWRAVKMLSGHSKNMHVQILRPELLVVVMAAEGKTGRCILIVI